jgi:hypothetical protein
MATASAGNILFSKLVAYSEATAGTIPTANFSNAAKGRKLLIQPTGYITVGTTLELGSDRSVALRNPLIATTATVVSTEPTASVTVPAVTAEELAIWLSMGKTVTAGTVSAGLFSWDYDYSMTTANSPTTYTLVATDGMQAYTLNYSLTDNITINADRNVLTSLSASIFSQAIGKTSSTTSEATPASPFLAGRLWNLYTHTSFPGTADGSVYSYLLDFSLSNFSTGNMKQAYLNGTTSFSTNAESGPFGGELQLTVSATSSAVSTWYDKMQSALPQYVRLSWTNGTQDIQILAAIVPTEVQPIGSSEDGLTTYAITGTLVYDPTSSKSLRIVIKNAINALP